MSLAEQPLFSAESMIRSAHFVGICGAGMKPIAKGLLSLGIRVSGSDLDLAKGSDLLSMGARLYEGHQRENFSNADVLVYSTAVHADNPEMMAARDLDVPIVHRSEMLGWLLARRESILVAGTHGKTTTTTLLSLLLEAAGLDPWSFVGGHVAEFGGNLRIGGDRYAVAEADESDGSFLNLPRRHAIIMNIEAEHLNYWGTEDRLFHGFHSFVDALPPTGNLVLCVDDPGICRFLSMIDSKPITYSVKGNPADYQATDIQLGGSGSKFTLLRNQQVVGTVEIGVPGMQNVANATGAFTMAIELGADPQLILGALAAFRGVDRRFTKRTSPAGYTVIDDYAHHPTEIRATVAATRLLADEQKGRIIAVFQPHRYTRTQDFFNDFGPALKDVDSLHLLEVYGAGEDPIPGVSGADLANKVKSQITANVEFTPSFEAIKKSIESTTKVGDIVLLLGAGSVTKLANLLTHPAGINVP